MEIIRGENVEIACPKCNALLRVYFEDVTYNDVSLKSPEFYCSCVSCGHRIDLTRQIPLRWKSKLDPF